MSAWIARLKCGHEAKVFSRPRIGGYLTCTELHCQGQRRIIGAASAGESTYVQGTLFGDAA
jgi:hypothetical protein